MSTEQFDSLIAVIGETDIWSNIINVLAILVSILIAVYTVGKTSKDNLKQSALDRRFEIYSELAYYLQQVTANHDNASSLRNNIFGLITKTYFFASEPINQLFQTFLDNNVYELEVERVNTQGKDRDTAFNEFDAYVFTLIEGMKYEAKYNKDITIQEVNKIKVQQFKNIGQYYN